MSIAKSGADVTAINNGSFIIFIYFATRRTNLEYPAFSNTCSLAVMLDKNAKNYRTMNDITPNTAVCVFTFFENKTRFTILNTTDLSVINNSLYYSDDKDKELYVGRKIRLKDIENKETKYIITDVIVYYFSGERFINRELIGDKSKYNVQIMVHLDKEE